MQVAIDPDEPTLGAFLDDFPGQFPEGDYGVPLDIFFFAKLDLSGHAERGSAVVDAKERRICAQIAGQDHQVVNRSDRSRSEGLAKGCEKCFQAGEEGFFGESQHWERYRSRE